MSTESNKQAPWWQPGLILFLKLNVWIVTPILVAMVIGKWLDKKLGTEPWLLVLSMLSAFVISSIGITKQGVKEFNRREESEKKDDDSGDVKEVDPNGAYPPRADWDDKKDGWDDTTGDGEDSWEKKDKF